jgi:4-hydroxybenzoyl-CoA thioesterase
VGRTYPDVFGSGLGSPTVKLEMEFISPVCYGDHVQIAVTVARIGQTSVQMRYEGSVDGRPVFSARNTMVIVDMKTFRPVPIPPWLRERLLAAAEPSTASG